MVAVAPVGDVSAIVDPDPSVIAKSRTFPAARAVLNLFE
jgi:hypothetical protein